jgi:hypothetical protein
MGQIGHNSLVPKLFTRPKLYIHVLFCCHSEQFETLLHTIDFMDDWLTGANIKSALQEGIVKYGQGKGVVVMPEICRRMDKMYT